MIIAGGRSDEPDENGFTPLHSATYTGSVGCLMKILAYRTNPNCADKRGWTPLHIASMKVSH
jgi:ankyrin repeat protein